MRCQKTLLRAAVAGLLLFGGASAGFAVLWKSSLYKCSVNLPDTSPQLNPWVVLSSAGGEDESGLVGVTGAHTTDFSAYVFLGVIRLDQKPKFQLNDKTLPELQKRYFGPGLGFCHSVQPIRRKDGLAGYRLTGTHQFRGRNYSVVVDFVQANNMLYEVAGLSQYDKDALKNRDLRTFLDSFRVTG